MNKIIKKSMIMFLVLLMFITAIPQKIYANNNSLEDLSLENIAGEGKAYAESTTATAGDITFLNDDNYTTSWSAASQNAFAGIKFDKPYIIEKIRIVFKDYKEEIGNNFDFNVQYYDSQKLSFINIFSGTNYDANNDDELIGHKYYSEIILDESIVTDDIRVNIFNNITSDLASIYEIEIFGKVNEEEKDPRLISVGKPVSATNSDNGTKPDYITDGSTTGSFWDGGPASKEKPQSFTIDLENGYFIDTFKVYPYVDGIRYYEYYIETSLDGINWNKVAERTADDGLAYMGETFELESPVSARFVRVVMTYNSKVIVEPANKSVHMREFEVYGEEDPNYEPPKEDSSDPDNVAFKKQVHSNLNTNTVKNIVDGFDGTSCVGEFAPAYFDVDLEQNYLLNDIVLSFPVMDGRYYYFSVYGSVDGSNYDRLYQERSNSLPEDGKYKIDLSQLKNKTYRIIRVYMEYVSDGTSSLLSEVRVHGTETQENTDQLRIGSIEDILDIEPYEDTKYAKPITTSETIENVYGIIDRNIGSKYRDWFHFEIAENPKEEYKNYDYYTIGFDPIENKIIITGNDGISLASGLNYYLKNYCKVNISEQANQTEMPKDIVKVNDLIYKYTPYEVRYAFNYCTLDYTFAYADAEDFQKEYDWLALNGVNVVMDLAGQEAVWIKFLMNFGYDFDSAKDWLAGPTYYAWQFMDNMEVIGGPVSDEWVKGRLEMARENQRWKNSLGMQTVLQGYAGMVPNNFKQYQPNVEILDQGTWCNVPRPDMIRTDGEIYDHYAKLFYEAERWAFGETSNYYAVDPFHEGGLRPDDLSDDVIAEEVLNSLLDYDKDAVWMVQAWWSNPTNDLLNGMGNNREDHVMILDLNGLNDAYDSYWDKTEYMGTKLDSTEFNQTSWVWCMLENYGGNPSMDGRPKEIIDRINHAYNTADHMKGIGFISEATYDNPVIYELLMDMAWTTEKIDLDAWIDDYIERRYGAQSENAKMAWDILLNTIYSRSGNTTQVIATTNPGFNKYSLPYSSKEVDRALELLFKDYDRLSASEAYRYDLTELMRQTVNNYAVIKLGEIKDAYDSKNVVRYKELKSQFLNAIDVLNTVCATQQNLLIGEWVGKAIEWAEDTNADDFAKDSMIINAKTLISVWAPSTSLLAYAYRNYEGMIQDVYGQLWNNFLTRNEEILQNGSSDIIPLDYKKLCMEWIYEDWEKQNYKKTADNSVENLKNVTQRTIEECSTYVELPENKGNIALNKKTWANDEVNSPGSSGGYARYVNDGNPDTYWDGGDYKLNDPWIIIDLGKEYNITKINVLPYVGNRYYLYDIYISDDNEEWNLLEQKTDTSIGTDSGDVYEYMEPVAARYIRLNGKFNSANESFHIKEIRVYGTDSVDKTGLDKAVKEAEKLEKEDYTASTWEVFSIALQDAKGVLIKEDATQEDVDKAVEALNNAKEALERRASEQLLEALSEKVNAAETLKDDYTTEEFKDVQAAIDVARALLANPEEAGSMDAVNALITLVQAISDLPEDPSFDKLREDLEETLKYVKENILNDTEGLRPGKVQELKDAVAEAEELLANPEVTADQLKSSLTKVTQKVQELWEIVNKDELNAVIASAKAIKAEGYTEESYDVLQEAIKAAEKVAANDDATTTEVSNAITAITDAIAGLEKTDIVDKSALEYEIGLAEIIVANIDDYRPSTVEGLADKLAAAKAVFEDATATQKAVDEAAATLREARLAARVKADLTALEEAIEKAKRYDLSKYTKESAQSLRDAISKAETVLRNEEATQEEADAAEKALNDSMKKLVLKNNVEGEADSTNTGATNQTAAFTGLFAVACTSLFIIMRKRKASQKEK